MTTPMLQQLQAAYSQLPEFYRNWLAQGETMRARAQDFDARERTWRSDEAAVKAGRAVVFRGATVAQRGEALAAEREQLLADIQQWKTGALNVIAAVAQLPDEVDSYQIKPRAIEALKAMSA